VFELLNEMNRKERCGRKTMQRDFMKHSMEPNSLHVSVWLDDLSSDGTFAEALEWASRLGLPLRAVVTPAQSPNHELHPPPVTPVVEKVKKWGNICAQRGVAMETSFCAGGIEAGIEQFLRPWGVCVFEENRSDPVREKLVTRCTRNEKVLSLLAPPAHRAMTRILILQHQQNPSSSFLQSAVRLCLGLEVQPLILTMASSERQARLGQSFAAGVCSSLRVQANFDSLVAFDFRGAVKQIAAWRNCSHVIVERANDVSLWQRLRGNGLWQHLQGDVFSELRSLAPSFALVGLPESLALEVPRRMQDNYFTYPRSQETKATYQ
jgi:hypothetical protein